MEYGHEVLYGMYVVATKGANYNLKHCVAITILFHAAKANLLAPRVFMLSMSLTAVKKDPKTSNPC